MQKKKSAAVGFFVLSMFVLVLLLVPQPVLAGHRVIKSVTVSTDNDNWGGPCPKEIRFTGVIQVNPLSIRDNTNLWLKIIGLSAPVDLRPEFGKFWWRNPAINT